MPLLFAVLLLISRPTVHCNTRQARDALHMYACIAFIYCISRPVPYLLAYIQWTIAQVLQGSLAYCAFARIGMHALCITVYLLLFIEVLQPSETRINIEFFQISRYWRRPFLTHF